MLVLQSLAAQIPADYDVRGLGRRARHRVAGARSRRDYLLRSLVRQVQPFPRWPDVTPAATLTYRVAAPSIVRAGGVAMLALEIAGTVYLWALATVFVTAAVMAGSDWVVCSNSVVPSWVSGSHPSQQSRAPHVQIDEGAGG
jgi:hypothetical protein